MHVPEIHEQRKKISGLKMPRRYAPRLPGASTKGQVPVNPYSGNKMKIASLADVRTQQLMKLASDEEALLYRRMEKLADSGDTLQIRLFLAQHPELKKEAGIIGHGFRLLSKALGKGSKMTGSATLSRYAAQSAKKSQQAFQQAATKAQGRVVAMEEGLRSGAGGKLTNQMAKADKYTDLAKQQGDWAKTHARTSGRMRASAVKPTNELVSNSTLGKALAGTAVVGGTGALAYGGYKGMQRGRQENAMLQQRGFDYGMQ